MHDGLQGAVEGKRLRLKGQKINHRSQFSFLERDGRIAAILEDDLRGER